MDLSDDDNVNALSLPRSLGQILTKRNPDRVNTLTNYTCDVVRLIRSEWWGMMCCPVQKLSLLVSMQVGAICLQIMHITANLACLRWVVTPRMPTTLLTPKMISKSILTWFFLSCMIPSRFHTHTGTNAHTHTQTGQVLRFEAGSEGSDTPRSPNWSQKVGKVKSTEFETVSMETQCSS